MNFMIETGDHQFNKQFFLIINSQLYIILTMEGEKRRKLED